MQPVGTRKTRHDRTRQDRPRGRRAVGRHAPERGVRGGRADVVARVQWDLLPAQEGNGGSVERVGRCYARVWWVGQQLRQVRRQARQHTFQRRQARFERGGTDRKGFAKQGTRCRSLRLSGGKIYCLKRVKSSSRIPHARDGTRNFRLNGEGSVHPCWTSWRTPFTCSGHQRVKAQLRKVRSQSNQQCPNLAILPTCTQEVQAFAWRFREHGGPFADAC